MVGELADLVGEDEATRQACVVRLGRGSKLVRTGLVRLCATTGEPQSLRYMSVVVAESVLAALRDDEVRPMPVGCRWLEPGCGFEDLVLRDEVRAATRAWVREPRFEVVIRGGRHSGRHTLVSAVAQLRGSAVMCIDVVRALRLPASVGSDGVRAPSLVMQLTARLRDALARRAARGAAGGVDDAAGARARRVGAHRISQGMG